VNSSRETKELNSSHLSSVKRSEKDIFDRGSRSFQDRKVEEATHMQVGGFIDQGELCGFGVKSRGRSFAIAPSLVTHFTSNSL
jgi:hypothetical protein